jgi:hypothetical protein
MDPRFVLVSAGALLITGLGLVAPPAPQKAAAPSVVVYKSPT